MSVPPGVITCDGRHLLAAQLMQDLSAKEIAELVKLYATANPNAGGTAFVEAVAEQVTKPNRMPGRWVGRVEKSLNGYGFIKTKQHPMLMQNGVPMDIYVPATEFPRDASGNPVLFKDSFVSFSLDMDGGKPKGLKLLQLDGDPFAGMPPMAMMPGMGAMVPPPPPPPPQ